MVENGEFAWKEFLVLPTLFVLVTMLLTVVVEKLLYNSLEISGYLFAILINAMKFSGIPITVLAVLAALWLLSVEFPPETNICAWILFLFGALCAFALVIELLFNGSIDIFTANIRDGAIAIWNSTNAAAVMIASLSLAAAITLGVLIAFKNKELATLKISISKQK